MPKNKTEFTPTEALKCLEGISKNRLYSMMANGEISFENKPWGKKTRRIISGPELTRVFGSAFYPKRLAGTAQKQPKGQTGTNQDDLKNTTGRPEITSETPVVLSQLEVMKHELRQKDKVIEDYQGRLKDALGIIDRQTLLIEDHHSKTRNMPKIDLDAEMGAESDKPSALGEKQMETKNTPKNHLWVIATGIITAVVVFATVLYVGAANQQALKDSVTHSILPKR